MVIRIGGGAGQAVIYSPEPGSFFPRDARLWDLRSHQADGGCCRNTARFGILEGRGDSRFVDICWLLGGGC